MTNIKLATENRKAVAQRLAEIIGGTSRYTKMPRCAYEVGPYFIEKDGTVTVPEDADLQPFLTLAEEGLLELFEIEAEVPAREADTAGTEAQDAVSVPTTENTEAAEKETGGAEDGLTISMPMDGFNPDSLDRLQKLVDSKASLITKAVDAARLTIRTTDSKVEFPWWDRIPEPEETQAYMSLIAALSQMAKEATRVTATEAEVESEKYAFRCFLLRLGFIGAEYKAERKILLKKLSGSAAFPNQEKADAFSAAQKEKREAAKVAATIEGPASTADGGEGCGEVTA